MKTVLAATAILAFSLAPALAECAGHVSADAAKPVTLASAAETTMSTPATAEPATDDTTTGAIKADQAD